MANKKKPADKKTNKTNGATGPAASATGDNTTKQSASQGGFRLQSQFISDLSFECPQPPAFLGQYKNNMQMDVGVQSKPVKNPKDESGAETYEVTLTLRGQNKTEDGTTVYLLEMKFSGVFALENIPDQHKGGLLGVEAPALLYPFARQTFMSTVAGSGFQPPLLEPINFAAIYMQQQQKAQAEQQQTANT